MKALSPEARSRIMTAVRAKNTRPELQVRSFLHRQGLRFRLHRKDLPGHPDLVLPAKRTAVFVHGCFWHQHNCGRGKLPTSNTDYWLPKLRRNVQRDKENQKALTELGWNVIVIWECELRDPSTLPKLARSISAIDTVSTRRIRKSS